MHMVNGMEYVYDARTHTKHAEIIITWNRFTVFLLSFIKFSRRFISYRNLLFIRQMCLRAVISHRAKKSLNSESGRLFEVCFI